MSFKVGDRVKVKSGRQNDVTFLGDGRKNEYGVVIVGDKYSTNYGIRFDEPNYAYHSLDGKCEPNHGYFVREELLVLINEKNSMENLISAFRNLAVGEPQKSFRKLGITDDNDLITQDGVQVFLSWLLTDKEISDRFKKEVVDGLIKEKEAKEKK